MYIIYELISLFFIYLSYKIASQTDAGRQEIIMKKTLYTLATCLFVTLQSSANETGYGEVLINWNARYLSENTVLVCDDKALSGVDLIIEGAYQNSSGELNPESYITTNECGADWKIIGKSLVQKNGKIYTKVRYDGGSGCEIKVHEKKSGAVPKKVFSVEISDAC